MIYIFFFPCGKKIADLGLATCRAWSRLTKEESRRKSRKGRSAGARGAGTLSYMAPEHLESIHTPSTEKSDVYSFAIVVWVILTGGEPYASELGGQQTDTSYPGIGSFSGLPPACRQLNKCIVYVAVRCQV